MAASSDSRLTRLDGGPVMSTRSAARLATTAWSPHVPLSVSDWMRQGRLLGTLGRATGWWIGDWMRYGSTRYGDRYAGASRVTGYDVQSLMNMAYVAGRFDAPRRREALSFSHHAELASLPPDEQDLWLDRAESSKLSVRSLRAELRDSRRRAARRARLSEARLAHRTTSAFHVVEADVVCPRCGHHFGVHPNAAKTDGPVRQAP